MSGPKKSTWQIEREEQRRLAEAMRQAKENELLDAIQQCEDSCSGLDKRHGDAARPSIERARTWLQEARQHASGDLRLGWRQLNGAEKYLAGLHEKMESAKQRAVATKHKADMPPNAEQSTAHDQDLDDARAKTEPYLARMERLARSCPALANQAVLQRIEVVRSAIACNPSNPQAIEQARMLCDRMETMAEEHEVQQAQRRHVLHAFSRIVGVQPPAASGDTPATISGSIDGMPVKLHFESSGNVMRLDTPERGDCKSALKHLQDQLGAQGIVLGPVQIVRTGENWNPAGRQSVDRLRSNA